MKRPNRLSVLLRTMLVTAEFSSCASLSAEPSRPRPAPPPTVSQPGRAANSACKRDDPSFGPVRLSADLYASRTGVMAQRFSDLGTTTKQRPLEECGLKTVLFRLVALRCDNGSNPFGKDLRAAHASRAGSFGPGGRCDSIIDRYDVPCPERTYQVFADGYVCPPGIAPE